MDWLSKKLKSLILKKMYNFSLFLNFFSISQNTYSISPIIRFSGQYSVELKNSGSQL